ncbi:MAG: serine hydrolase [Bacteroidetes bacterium]|nr:MAG: serine hydrolase [Bacteroidota bacterium]
MKSIPLIFLNIILLCLCGCSTRSGHESAEKAAPNQFSTSYVPPVFKEQERIQKIGLALAESHHYYIEYSANQHLPGIAYGLVVDDSLVFFGASGVTNLETGSSVTEHSLFRIASMTKSFTAMAILKLRDEGKLSLSDPVSRYMPELEQLKYLTADASTITIFNLLTMTAGFPEDNPWGDRFLDISDDALMGQVEEGISFSSVPSLHYEYSNLGFGLLGHIITAVSDLPYQEYITRNILHPLDMTSTFWEYSEVPEELLAQGYWWEDERWVAEPLLHDGAFGAMGGLITSIEDFSKYVSYHLSAWPARSDAESGPVKRSTLREMHSLNKPRYLSDSKWFGNDTRPMIQGYGYGLRGIKDLEGVLEMGHGGGLPGFGSSYMFYPQHGIGIMAFSNLTYAGGIVKKANYKVISKLIDQGLFRPRILPASEILELRKEQVAQLIVSWDPELEKDIVAANLYMDISRERRMSEASELLNQLGEIVSTGPVIPENQLRGSFFLKGKEQNLRVDFTLTPEADPKVQWLTLQLTD